MKKRIIALTASLVTLIASVTSTSSVAAYVTSYDDAEFSEVIEGCEELDEKYWWLGINSDYVDKYGNKVTLGEPADKVYFKVDGTVTDDNGYTYDNYYYVTVRDKPDVLEYTLAEGVQLQDVSLRLRKYNEENGTEFSTAVVGGSHGTKYWLGYSNSTRQYVDSPDVRNLDKADAEALAQLLKAEKLIKESEFVTGRVEYSNGNEKELLFHYCCIDNVKNYIIANNIDCSVEVRMFEPELGEEHIDCTHAYFAVVPNHEMDTHEKLLLTKELMSNANASLVGKYDLRINHKLCRILAHNVGWEYTPGDANCDGKVDLSDAVLIMQCLGNPGKYQLSRQGKINADVTEDMDGVTAMDALLIQKVVLGVAKFPY